MRVIDGSTGGGQILRTSLALSLHTGDAFRIDSIRSRRKRPGLMRQHLTCVRAAAEVSNATVEGAELSSSSLTFRPGPVRGGHYEFSIATAGSTGLVLQTLLTALTVADAPSVVRVRGGTHNPLSPPYDFLERTYVPALKAMGPDVSLQLERHGFFPAGGGSVVASINPVTRLGAFERTERGALVSASARILLAGIGNRVANRERDRLVKKLDWSEDQVAIVGLPEEVGPGNVIGAALEYECGTELITGFGMRGVTAERVAGRVARDVKAALERDAAVGRHLANQLLLPLAVGAGGSFTTPLPLDDHFTSNAALLREWLGVAIEVAPISDSTAEIRVEPLA